MTTEQLSVLDAIHSLRAVRIYKQDPVEPEKITRVLRAGTFAPSSGNVQPWEFVVITKTETKKKLQKLIEPAFEAMDSRGRVQTRAEMKDSTGRLVSGHVGVDNMVKTPVLILACYNPVRGRRMKDEYRWFEEHAGKGGSLFPAIQNMMLAAKALGLGTLLTTLVTLREYDVKKLLGIPDYINLVALVYLGYPDEKLGKPRRKPLTEVAHMEAWGNPYPG